MSKFDKQGDYSHITLSQIVASAKMRLRIESSDEDIFLERYANEGARHMDSKSTFLKRDCELEIVNGKAKLPVGFYQMLSVSPCDGSGAFYVDQPFLIGCGLTLESNFISGSAIFQIQDGYIYFTLQPTFSEDHGTFVVGTTTYTANATNVQNGPPHVTSMIRISYISMNIDDNGMMVVYSDMERGLVAYCVWMHMLDSPPGKYSPQQIQANEMIWINQKSWYKSVQFQNDFRNTRRQVASVANAWITGKDWYI